MRQTTFANLRIGEAPQGYYTDLFLALLDTDATHADGMCSHIRELADIVLARAQLTVCNVSTPKCSPNSSLANFGRGSADDHSGCNFGGELMRTIFIEADARTLVIENASGRLNYFRQKLPHATFADNPQDAVRLIRTSPAFDYAFVDFDLNGGSSRDAARLLADQPWTHCLIHTTNDLGAGVLNRILPHAEICEFGSFEIQVESSKRTPTIEVPQFGSIHNWFEVVAEELAKLSPADRREFAAAIRKSYEHFRGGQ
jgi:hypothetical protein